MFFTAGCQAVWWPWWKASQSLCSARCFEGARLSWTRHQQVRTKLPCALHLPLNSWRSESSELLLLLQGVSPASSACKMYIRGRQGQQLLGCGALESRGHDRRGFATSCFLFFSSEQWSWTRSAHLFPATFLPACFVWHDHLIERFGVTVCTLYTHVAPWRCSHKSNKSLAQEDGIGWRCSKALPRAKDTLQPWAQCIPLETLFISWRKDLLRHILWCLLAWVRCIQPLVFPMRSSQQPRWAQFTFLAGTMNHSVTLTRAKHYFTRKWRITK